MNITFNSDGSVEVDNLLESAEEYYSGLNSLGETMEMAHEGFLMGLGLALGITGARSVASAASGAGIGLFGAEFYHNNFAVNAGSIADAIDDLQNQMEIASETGNWQNPELQAALDLVKSIYPNQNRFSGIYTAPDLIQLVEQAIAQGSTELTADDIANIDLSPSHCFKGDTPIRMWPLDPSIKPRVDGTYDEQIVLSKAWEKPINKVQESDFVLSYDAYGNLKPGIVVRTMENHVQHVLNFWGTGVTPGHAYLCAEGQFVGQHVPLIDILRTDGAVQLDSGKFIRAATGYEVGSFEDQMVHVIIGEKQANGLVKPQEHAQLRLGTRILLDDGTQVTLLDLITSNGGKVTDDGFVESLETGRKMPFLWTFSESLPKPEDFILQRSGLTLEEIYEANEWEQIGTQMAGPPSSKRDTSPTDTLLM